MEPVCALVNLRRSFLFILYLVIHQRVLPDITVKPLDSESSVNESTYFNCSSNITGAKIEWYHYPVGVEAHEVKSVYAFEKFYTGYQEDFSLEKNSPHGSCNLVIKSVKPSYAGRYECHDDGGHSTSAQLIVLDGEPECSSDVNLDGVIGPNACGIQPDELHLSCSISYHGHIPPELKWIKLGESDSINVNGTKSQSYGRFTHNLNIKADRIDNKSSFECQTTKSRTSKHRCTTETVKLLYIFGTSSLSVKNIDEVVNCSANTSSKFCQYKWKWYNGENTLTVSDNRILTVEKEGQYQCEATCDLRGEKCTVDAILVNATLGSSINDSGDSTATNVWVTIMVGVIIISVVLAVLIIIICRRKHRHKDFAWHAELLHAESAKSADNQKTVITGLAVLDKELFLVCENNSFVKVFHTTPFSFLRSIEVLALDNPLDLVSSPMHSALFISSQREIFQIYKNGKVIWKRPIEDGGGTLSVTHKQTVLLSVWKTSMLREYSVDGELICEVKLPSGVCPFHAVKTLDGQFVVSYEHEMKHMVAKFDVRGTITQSFSGKLKLPRYMVMRSNEYIFVADRNNGRVLMMNPSLESSKVLLTQDELGRPSRICLDRENSQMFVADNKADNPKFMVFRLYKHKTGTFGGLFKTLEVGDRHVEGTTPLIEVQGLDASPSFESCRINEINVKDDANPVGENFAEEAIPLIEVTGTTENKPIIIPDDEQDRDASTSPEEEYPALDWHPEFLHVESLKSLDNEKPVISGLAVLNKELFVVCENNSTVKVFQAIGFRSERSFSVMDLDNPLDIVSSPMHGTLFMSSQKEIFKIDASGKVVVKWPIEDGGGTLSATHEQTVLLSVWKISMLREYSAHGEVICEVKLPAGVCPFHAVKTEVGQFVVSYEQGMVQMIAKFDTNGTIIQTFSGIVNFPKYLAVNCDGCVFVVDRNNGRVLMLDPSLESSKVLLRNTDKLVRPLRICLDQENSRMFVADSKADNPRFIVFRFYKYKTGGMGENSGVFSDSDEEECLDADNTFVGSRGPNEEIAVNQYEPLVSSHNLIEVPGPNEEIAVNQYEPLVSSHNLIEVPGANEAMIQKEPLDSNHKDMGELVEVVSGNTSGNEEGDEELPGEKDPLEEKQSGKRKRSE